MPLQISVSVVPDTTYTILFDSSKHRPYDLVLSQRSNESPKITLDKRGIAIAGPLAQPKAELKCLRQYEERIVVPKIQPPGVYDVRQRLRLVGCVIGNGPVLILLDKR